MRRDKKKLGLEVKNKPVILDIVVDSFILFI